MTGAIVATLLFLTAMSNLQIVTASAPSGLSTTLTSSASSTLDITATSSLMASSTNQCTSRVISTTGALRITFTDVQTPANDYGHQQAADTNVVYDGGLYGCGTIKAYAVATSTIFISEFK